MGFFVDQSADSWALLVDNWPTRPYKVNTLLFVCQKQEPAVLPSSTTQPYYAPSQPTAYDAGTEDIRRRQEELERKAAELERRERAMQQSVQGQSKCHAPSVGRLTTGVGIAGKIGRIEPRAPISQPFSRESPPNPNLGSDRAAQQVCDHSHSVRLCCLQSLNAPGLSELALPLDTVSTRVACLCPLGDILPHSSKCAAAAAG